MKNRKVVRSYDKEFKLNTVKLYLEKGLSYKKIAEELGIPQTTVVGWVESHKRDEIAAFPGKGYLKPSEAEWAQLRKELSIAREERDILKKALGVFSSMRK